MSKFDEVLLYIYDKTKDGGNTDISNMDFGEIIYDLQSQNLIIFHSHTPHLVRISEPGKKYVEKHILNPKPTNAQSLTIKAKKFNNYAPINQIQDSSNALNNTLKKKYNVKDTLKKIIKTLSKIPKIWFISILLISIIYTIFRYLLSWFNSSF